MAIVTANSSLQLGFYRGSSNGVGVLIDSPSAGLALPFIADFTGNITRIALFTGNILVYTFTPTFTFTDVISTDITNLDIGIMGSNATGNLPSDTFLATPNTISITASPPPLYYIINLDNTVPVVKGNVYWIAYKPNASFTGKIVVTVTSGTYIFNGFWKIANRTSSTWSRGGQFAHVMYGSDTHWYSNDVPIHPTAISSGLLVSDREYGFSFTLKSDHPAIRVSSISLEGPSLENIANMIVSCNVRSQAGSLLHTFETYNTNTLSNNNNFIFEGHDLGHDLWLEPNTKYYIMLAFNGTFPPTKSFRNYIFDPTWDDADGAFTSNYAVRMSDGTITETTTLYYPFQIFSNSVRFDDTQKDIYINASPMFSGGFSG
jgi:hypothetical protein